MTVAEAAGRALAALGVGACFGVVGSGNFAVTNALRAAGVPFVAARHEGGAATMADAHARMSGKVALLSVHQGCGLTNATTGIGEAAKSRTPLIVLAAEAGAGAVTSNFAMDQDALARSVGAVSERVHSAATALADVVRAYRTARDGRRTVVLNLPLDVQGQTLPADALTRMPVPPVIPPVRPAASAVEALADLLEAAERPVFVAGRGARGAGPELRALAARSGSLLATSAVANGLFAGEEFALGISGGFSSPLAAELIADADLVVGFGCALNMWTMRHGALIGPAARIVQVDDTGSALGAHRSIDLGVLGDVGATAADLLAELERRSGESPRPGYRSPELAERLHASIRWNDTPTPDLSGPDAAGETRIDPRVLSARLDELLPAERIVSIDSGNFMGYPSAYLRVPDEHGFCFTQAFQSIGLGLGTAIGAALARPDRLPVLGTGDGGFLMAISELETAVRLRVPLVVVVYDDAAYGAEVHHFGPADPTADLGAVVFPDVDLAAIARGYGATGLTVRSVADLDAVADWLASGPAAPLVIDAKIAADGGSWWLQEAFRGH
ncbi:thiamine pyrophosphate-binding protein [Agromyces seonyuensis]|uniref:Thiamine pyrophosphate-binding protein n=1 Tax=Agromyces seonyuensis TaxID=2662446 RepID=A0A6I4NZT6_9MICO|nr:thiamine pyrophosphate-binding protein [Agromyces seonyuensis]MWB97945.1 thiamine pyrophosphate-binding protein [Agromyces seonyuensis]